MERHIRWQRDQPRHRGRHRGGPARPGDPPVRAAHRARDRRRDRRPRRARPHAQAHARRPRAGTFTISNPGSVGAVSATAIINQPQVAILGMPAIQRRPVVVTDAAGQEAIAIRPIMLLALTFDHRAVDGAEATRCVVRDQGAARALGDGLVWISCRGGLPRGDPRSARVVHASTRAWRGAAPRSLADRAGGLCPHPLELLAL